MFTVFLMAVATLTSIFFMIVAGKADRMSAAEIVLSKMWTNRFARQTLTEKKELFIEKNKKYHDVSEKKEAKKVKEWDKQIIAYQKKEEKYHSGQEFTIFDAIPMFGYRVLADLKLDYESDILRKLTLSCEHTGYIELERNQETGNRKNSSIYAYYLLASLISYAVMGVIVACFLGVVVTASGNTIKNVMVVMGVGFVGSALYGYLPYDNLQTTAKKRQEKIDQSFPNAISKIALLVTAGMNIAKAIEETAKSDDSMINRELKIAVKEMNQANSVQGAFVRLQCRCDNRYLDKMITIVTKSYVAGNTNLAEDLKAINDECWLDKKHNTRRMSEMVQNKLFIPTMLMFVGILVVIVVPAMAGFNL